VEAYNVFLSWSGPTSKAIAEAWRRWLPLTIQAAKPWMSDTDIPKGRPWFSELAEQLKGIRIGIICITPDNLLAPSIHFEAGALSKTVSDVAYVCPYLFNVKESELKFPMADFQATKAQQEDTRKLLRTLNQALQAGLTGEQVDAVFDKWWPDLERSLKAVQAPTGPAQPQREEREILEEVLELVRDLARRPEVSTEPSVYIPIEEPRTLYGLGALRQPVTLRNLLGTLQADVYPAVSGATAPPPLPTPIPAPEPTALPTPTAAPAPPPLAPTPRPAPEPTPLPTPKMVPAPPPLDRASRVHVVPGKRRP